MANAFLATRSNETFLYERKHLRVHRLLLIYVRRQTELKKCLLCPSTQYGFVVVPESSTKVCCLYEKNTVYILC